MIDMDLNEARKLALADRKGVSSARYDRAIALLADAGEGALRQLCHIKACVNRMEIMIAKNNLAGIIRELGDIK